MKKTILAVTLFCAFLGLYGKGKAFEFKPEVLTKVIKPGEQLKIKLNCKAPANYTPRAWRLVAYVPNVPNDFAKATGGKITPNKLKQWSTVHVMNWIWHVPADKTIVKSTAKWPAGDYKMACYIILQEKDKNNKIQTKMLSAEVLFMLKK